MGLLSQTVKEKTDVNDEVLVNNMIASAMAGANAYLNAAMTSATPEIRAMYSANLNQVMGGEAALTELAVNKGWDNPYAAPAQQLNDVYIKARSVARNDG